jgi:hypothetical protein
MINIQGIKNKKNNIFFQIKCVKKKKQKNKDKKKNGNKHDTNINYNEEKYIKKLVFYKKIKNYNFTTETVKSWQNLQL